MSQKSDPPTSPHLRLRLKKGDFEKILQAYPVLPLGRVAGMYRYVRVMATRFENSDRVSPESVNTLMRVRRIERDYPKGFVVLSPAIIALEAPD